MTKHLLLDVSLAVILSVLNFEFRSLIFVSDVRSAKRIIIDNRFAQTASIWYRASMRAVVQRVKKSSVQVEKDLIAEIGSGLVVLLGVAGHDSTKDADYMAQKISNLRIFEDEKGKMNRSLIETGGQMLVVSQFTLLADCRKGRRPSFVLAAPPEKAIQLYEHFVTQVRQKGIEVATGRFQAMMAVSLINHGPVTLILES